MNNKEIERKWLLKELPNLKPIAHYNIEQFYISTYPEVRLRKSVPVDSQSPHKVPYKITIKSNGSLVRDEIEEEVSEDFYEKCKLFVGLTPINKDYYIYMIDKYMFEVSVVDNNFIYGEVEFSSEESANDFILPIDSAIEVTNNSDYRMRNYWIEKHIT